MDDNIFKGNTNHENSDKEIDAINDNLKFFGRLQNLQTLIKKESSLKELCKNLK